MPKVTKLSLIRMKMRTSWVLTDMLVLKVCHLVVKRWQRTGLRSCVLAHSSPPVSLLPPAGPAHAFPWADMEDSGPNKELKQTLELSSHEKESKEEEQKSATESTEASSQSPEKSEVQKSKAVFTPPRTPPKSTWEADTARDSDSPDPALRTPESDPRRGVEMPASPEKRSHVLPGGSPFTPKVSGLCDWRDVGSHGMIPGLSPLHVYWRAAHNVGLDPSPHLLW